MRTISEIEKCFKLMLWIYWIAGLSVIEIPVGHPWLKLSVVFAIGRWTIYIYLLLYPLERIVDNTQTSTFDKIFVFVHYTNIFSAITSTIVEFYNYKKYIRFTTSISMVDKTLGILGVDPKYTETYKKNKQRILGWCFGVFLLYAAIMLMSRYIFVRTFHMYIFFIIYEVPVIWNSLIELNLTIQIDTLGERFDKLNTFIKKMTIIPLEINLNNLDKVKNIFKKKQTPMSMISNYYYYYNRHNMKFFFKITRQVHLDLCKIFREVNHTYNRQISMQMFALFVLLIGLSYFPYYIYNENTIPFYIKIQLNISIVLFLTFNVGRIIHITYVIVNATEQAHRSSQILYEIVISQSQFRLINEAHQFSMQLMQHPLRFIIAGSTSLNFNYLGELIGSLVTYLMLLIQTEIGIMENTKVRFVESMNLVKNST